MKYIHIKEILQTSATEVQAHLIVGGNEEVITTTVSQNVAQYLTIDRCDAFVVALLYFAISQGYDIKSDIPISEELYYNLENHFLDALSSDEMGLHRVRLDVTRIKACEKIGSVVSTGISCGVDSLYTVATHSDSSIPDQFRISHLAFFDVGSHSANSDDDVKELYEGRYNNSKSFAEEYGFEFFTVSSDVYKLITKYVTYSHVANHTFLSSFCVLLLQKGIKTYYYSAGHSYKDFRCYKQFKNEDFDAALYDLLTFSCISVNGLRIYSSGGSKSRIEKTKLLTTYPPAYKYLNVCVRNSKNDSTCFKCVRTLLGIDATSDINNFSQVFDIEYYKQHRKEYIKQMYILGTFGGDHLIDEPRPYFKKELTPVFKIKAICSKLFIKTVLLRLYRRYR